MTTQMEAALTGNATPAMRRVAQKENLDLEHILEGVARGTIVIPANMHHEGLDPSGIGSGLRTKVNANIGTSASLPDTEAEMKKLDVAIQAGADAVMDLSMGSTPEIDATRRAILARSPVMIGTVPVYQASAEARERRGAIVFMTPDDLFATIEKQCSDGVDFITVHCGITLETVNRLRSEGRVTDIVSRGGALLTGWMLHHEEENPLFSQYDRLLEIARKYDATLSLGDALRPGCLADATDRSQIQELIILGELVDRAREAGVQAMVEGPGHIPLDQVETNVKLQKSLCHGAPFYVLGPIVTDVAPGYDHITSCIGGALAAAGGADFLCYVTPAEHLGLPDEQDVKEGIVAARIAAHTGDLIKRVPGAWEWDLQMAKARKALDWEQQIDLAIDPVRAREYRDAKNVEGTRQCTMCGPYCAMEIAAEALGKKEPCPEDVRGGGPS